MQGNVAVLDIGKTNVKLSVATSDGKILETLSHPNEVRPGPPWRHHELAGLGAWVMEGIATLARRHPIAHLVPVGHGSGGVLVGADPDAPGGGAALPMPDYEEPCPADVDAAYRAQAGSFSDRGSAVMMASTHAARQLLRMESEAPEAVGRARWYLNVAQYWAWWLGGVAASEFTAMGAQSHFWNVPERRWSPIVAARGWQRLMPPFRAASDALGPIRPELARRHGLGSSLVVHAGAHDSSANFYRYHAAGMRNFTLVSTGTWVVALSREADLSGLDEARGCTINADPWGNPVGGALTMGGRAFSALAGPATGLARLDALAAVVGRGTLALPSFGEDAGQFPGAAGRGRIVGEPVADNEERLALALLHAALLTAACVTTLGGGRRLVLDGSFLRDPLYARLVAAVLPDRPVSLSHESSGVAAGAALHSADAAGRPPVPIALEDVRPVDLPGLSDYATRWAALARAHAATGEPR